MHFEDSINKIEKILEQLENGNLPLENAIALYEQGIYISNNCKKQLNEARLKITEKNTGGNDEITE